MMRTKLSYAAAVLAVVILLAGIALGLSLASLATLLADLDPDLGSAGEEPGDEPVLALGGDLHDSVRPRGADPDIPHEPQHVVLVLDQPAGGHDQRVVLREVDRLHRLVQGRQAPEIRLVVVGRVFFGQVAARRVVDETPVAAVASSGARSSCFR